MRNVARWLLRINSKYDRLQEPWRILTFLGPIMFAGILGGLLTYFGNEWLSVFGGSFMMFTMMILGLFRIPCFIMDKKWANTYIVGSRFKFKHAVEVSYFLHTGREELTEWASKNTKRYRGVFDPDGKATFYFARESDAMAFKLRWI